MVFMLISHPGVLARKDPVPAIPHILSPIQTHNQEPPPPLPMLLIPEKAALGI
jgi:hypothetical protein